jgi:hypothetical protein
MPPDAAWPTTAGRQVYGLARHGGGRVRHLRMVDWFNHRRPLKPIGNVPPAEVEARYYV